MTENLADTSSIIDAGFDYLTLSLPVRHAQRREFIAFAEEQLERMQSEGYGNRRRKIMQYNGIGNPQFFYGSDGYYDLLRVSGREAKGVADELRKRELRAKPTRLDLQVTTANGCRVNDFAQQLVSEIRGNAKRTKGARAVAIAAFSGPFRDTGAALGSRKSETYTRVYDAHVRHPISYPAFSRRVETEYKGSKAESAYIKFMQHGHQDLLAQQFNAGEFKKHGILEEWMKEVIPCIPNGITVKSTDEKRLWWLANQVVPVVKKLMQTEHAPYIRALFLDAVGPNPIPKRGYTTPEQRLYND